VDYRGKRVLSRAHVPIVNVKYHNNQCGPFRDWLNQEGTFQASGEDRGPGFRDCVEPPLTIADTRSDAGNFYGVAVHVDGDTVSLTSEMDASWYRYAQRWKLRADGTIEPTFQFSAVTDSCVCIAHVHHAYWRFDFDVAGDRDDVVEEFNEPPEQGSSGWNPLQQEIRRLRDASRARAWRIRDALTGYGYALVPGQNDGNSDTWGVGDVWVLRQHDDELSDQAGTSPETIDQGVGLDGFLNGESVDGENVVLWYAGHVVHDENSGQTAVGPTLAPFAW
jgi:Cu2+-containing amine oxidase